MKLSNNIVPFLTQLHDKIKLLPPAIYFRVQGNNEQDIKERAGACAI
jgi:hypothetical protein